MEDVPSLFSLCLKAIEMAIIHGYDQMHNIFELPSDLLECLLADLCSLALQNLHEELTVIEFESPKSGSSNNSVDRRKRRRSLDLNGRWKILLQMQWPDHMKQSKKHSFTKNDERREMCEAMDWQQLYWERHLQRCLDEASETALLPSFNGCISELTVSDTTVQSIGCREDADLPACKRLSYHCQKFGYYARRLRLQNVLCVAETHELLSSSNLREVVFCNIKSVIHVEGLCCLLRQKRKTLLSIKFLHCKFPPNALDEISDSIGINGTENAIQHLSFTSSSVSANNLGSVSGFLCFLSSQRSLLSLKFSETQMESLFAKAIFDALAKCSSKLSTLELSDNNITGWLSKSLGGSRSMFPSCLELDPSFKLLQVLNLRGNNLCKDDAEDLKCVLIHMRSLRSLDVSDNPLTDDGIRSLLPYFSEAFEKSFPLSSIKLDDCCLSSMGVSQLLTTFFSSNQPLKCLSIAENNLGRLVLPMYSTSVGKSFEKFISPRTQY